MGIEPHPAISMGLIPAVELTRPGRVLGPYWQGGIPSDSEVETGHSAGIEPYSAPTDGWQGTYRDDEMAPTPADRT